LLSTVAHDLKNPFNSMTHLIETAEKNNKKQFEEADFDILQGNSKTIMSFINDILDYCLFKSSSFNLLIDKFNLNEMIREVYNTMKVYINLKMLDLIVENELPSNVEMISDRQRICQILYNFIENAIKFTRNG